MQFSVSGLLQPFQRLLEGVLFPALEQQVGPLSSKHRQLVEILGLAEVESLVMPWRGGVGRPARHRRAMARTLVAKAVLNLSATRQLLDRLAADDVLRRLCGWESAHEVPHEAQFSRAFAEFAATELPQRLRTATRTGIERPRAFRSN
ncbi:MAG: transposase [Terriglobia bacterium]